MDRSIRKPTFPPLKGAPDDDTPRRGRFPHAASAALAATAAALLLGGAAAAEGFFDPSVVRLLTVGAVLTDDGTGATVLDGVVADFEAQTGYDVVVTQGNIDIFDQALFGGADIVMAHLGFDPLHEFVVRPVLYEAAGRPDPGTWSIDLGQQGPPAVRAAAMRGGYTIWGLHPFLNLQASPQPTNLEGVVFDDSIMQRILATVVVRWPRFLVNHEGATAFQEHLTQPATQAKIRAFRVPGIDAPIFWPAGNQNDN